MKLREETFYKNLNPYLATAYAEGYCEGENATEQEQLCAWQYLVDTKICWNLQGTFGRIATDLINSGYIEPKIESEVIHG